MPLNLEDKKVLVAEVAEVAKTALSVVAAENRGLTVSQMTDLRAKARASGVYMRVVKNTLARKAFVGTPFAKDNEKLVAPLVSLGGEVLSAKDLEKVATLPTKDQARAQLLGLLMSPAQQLAAVIAAPATDLARVIAAYADKRKGEAGAPA